MNSTSKTIAGRLKGEDLAAFEQLQAQEKLSQSATMALIVSEWRQFTKKAPPPARFATIDPERFNVCLGAVVKLTRTLHGCQSALKAPRPVLPDDEAMWMEIWKQASQSFNSVDGTVAGLVETAKLIETPPPDRTAAFKLARWSYVWTGSTGEFYRQVLMAVMKPWVGTVPPPAPNLPPAQPQNTNQDQGGRSA